MKKTTEETRIDRIERYLEEFTKDFSKGMLELKESQQKTGEQILELKESQKKTDEQLNRTEAMLNKTITKLEKVGKQLADQGLVQGEVAEELFYRNVKGLFRPGQQDTGRNRSAGGER